MADVVQAFRRGKCDKPEDTLRDALSYASTGKLAAVVVVGVTDDGYVITGGSGYDGRRFSLMGGLAHMINEVERGID